MGFEKTELEKYLYEQGIELISIPSINGLYVRLRKNNRYVETTISQSDILFANIDVIELKVRECAKRLLEDIEEGL